MKTHIMRCISTFIVVVQNVPSMFCVCRNVLVCVCVSHLCVWLQELKLLLHRSTLLKTQGQKHHYLDAMITMISMLLKVTHTHAACRGVV